MLRTTRTQHSIALAENNAYHGPFSLNAEYDLLIYKFTVI